MLAFVRSMTDGYGEAAVAPEGVPAEIMMGELGELEVALNCARAFRQIIRDVRPPTAQALRLRIFRMFLFIY
jgi:hypothetical protein